MADTLKYVKEKMGEGDLYATITWNAIKATIVMVAILFAGYIILPFSATQVPGTFWLSLAVTFAVLAYVFRKHIYTAEAKDSMWELLKNCAIWFIIALSYSIIMYVGGEIIFIGLIVLGVIMIVIFLSGDFSLTSIFTYKDLEKWVKEQTKVDAMRAQEKADKERAGLVAD